MKTRITICLMLMLGVLMCCGGLAQATEFYDSNTIAAGDTYFGVAVWNSAIITMTGGSVTNTMFLYDTSTLNVSGGSVHIVGAGDSSTVNVSGGSVGYLSLGSNATGTLSGSGSIGTGGASDSSVFNINGGTIARTGANNNGILNLRGGTITDSLNITSTSTGTVNIFGYGLAMSETGGTYGDGQITGFWQDGLPFTINLAGTDEYSTINLIPEPTTLLLLGISTFLLRKSKGRM